MSWNLVNNNSNLDLYCNTLRCAKVVNPTDTDGEVVLTADFYTGSTAVDYTLQKSANLVYKVVNNIMYIRRQNPTGFFITIPNPSGTGWSNMKLGNWNGGNPIPLSIPYKLNSTDKIYSTTIPIQTPANVFKSSRVQLTSDVGDINGNWLLTFFMEYPVTDFPNSQYLQIDNFFISVPVVKL